MTTQIVDSVGIVLKNARAEFPRHLSAFEQALEGGDPQLIFLRGGELMASLYSIGHNQLNAARRSSEEALEVGHSILNVAHKLREELEI